MPGRCAKGPPGRKATAFPLPFSRGKKHIGRVLACFRELSQAKETYDAACQALDEADAAEIQAKGALRDGQLLEQQERDNLLEAVARWQDSSQELRLSTEELPSLKRMVVQYRSPADWAQRSAALSVPATWSVSAGCRARKTKRSSN